MHLYIYFLPKAQYKSPPTERVVRGPWEGVSTSGGRLRQGSACFQVVQPRAGRRGRRAHLGGHPAGGAHEGAAAEVLPGGGGVAEDAAADAAARAAHRSAVLAAARLPASQGLREQRRRLRGGEMVQLTSLHQIKFTGRNGRGDSNKAGLGWPGHPGRS